MIFFCACKTPRDGGHRACHRDLVAELVVNEAQRRKVALSVVEWPGGAPRHLAAAFPPAAARARQEGAQSVPVPRGVSPATAVAVPWGSYARVGEDDVPVVVGPAIHAQGRWAFPLPWHLDEDAQTEPRLRQEIMLMRKAWGHEPRYSLSSPGLSEAGREDLSSPPSRDRAKRSTPRREYLPDADLGARCTDSREEAAPDDDCEVGGMADDVEPPKASLTELLHVDSGQWSRPRTISRILQ